MPAVFQHYH